MSTRKSHASKRWLVLIMTINWMVLTSGRENSILVKRDTTLENVKAMYNRFVSDSTGKAKYADAGNNACSMDLPPSVTKTPGIVHVAASKHDFQGSLGCGVCLKIVGSGKPVAADLDGSPPVEGSLKAIIVDQDDSLNQGDLALLPPQTGSGLWEISFKAADCPSAQGPTGYIQFRFTGSNDMYFKLQAMNAKVPVAGIEAFERVKGKWFCLTRTTNNFFTNEGMGAVSFPLKVRLTSIMNEQLEATINALGNDEVINSDVQFSDTEVRGGSPEGIKCYGQGDRPSSPEGDEGFCVSKEDGIYTDPKDETAFYVCQGEKATKKFCPTGLKFNPVISSCDVPEDVKFVGAEAESAGSFASKEDSRWISLQGDGSLKVFSVGESEKPTKEDDKVISKVPQPHKLFSINIFNGVQSHAVHQLPRRNQNKSASGGRFQGHFQDNVVNITSEESAPPNGKTKKPELVSETEIKSKDHKGLQNSSNQTIDENNSVTVSPSQTLQPANNGSLNQKMDQKEWVSYEGKTKNSRDSAGIIRLTNVSENHLSSNDLSHFSSTPHKLFAINIYGSHPQLLRVQHEMKTTTENTLEGKHTKEQVDQYRDANFFTDNSQKVQVHSSEFQISKGEVLKSPGQLTTDINEKKTENANFWGENNTFSTNDSISSMPLHFKLKVNMDNSGKQPVINCTLSECPENDFVIQEDKTNTSKQPVNGSKPEPVVPQQKFGSENNSKLGDFRVMFKTGHPESMTQKEEVKESPALPMNLTKIILAPHLQNVTNLTQQKDSYQAGLQQLKVSSKQQNGGAPSLHHNDTISLETGKNRERGEAKTDDNTKTMKSGDVDKPDRIAGANQQTSLTDKKNSSDSKGSLDGKYETDINMKEPTRTTYKDPNQEPGSEKSSDKFKGQKENLPNNNFQTNLKSDSVTKQLENANIKSPFLEQQQLGNHDFVQIQSLPQLKIILKNPGRILNPLNRRSDAKGHIVKILKSLIDRPLELGSKGKEVVSMLSSLANKKVTGTVRENIPQDDSKAVEDSGNIAQSILEANKEYLDAIAMQGMVFSDGDPETENMTSIDGSINHSHGYRSQEYEASQWKSPHTEGRDSSTVSHEHSLGVTTHQDDSVHGEYLITRLQEDGGSGESVSGMESNKDVGSGKPGRVSGSKGLLNSPDMVSTTGGPDGASEMNAYRGGMRRPKVDSRLKSFCIGKSNGIYTNPFEQKSFVVCSNGVSEERECPGTLLFNPKEKMCDIPDQRKPVRTKKRKETTS